MTGLESGLDLAVLGAVTVLCAVLGLLAPRIIARVPEPVRTPVEEHPETDAGFVDQAPKPEEPAKQSYADVARLPGLAWRCAVVGALTGALLVLGTGAAWVLLVLVPLVPLGLALAVIDWRTRLLPYVLVAPSYVVVGVLVLLVGVIEGDVDLLVRATVGWLGSFAVFYLLNLVSPRGMGYGDVRLAGVLGMALGAVGWIELVVGMYAGFLVGGVLGLVLSVLRVVDRKAYPFGPFMLAGAVLGVALGPWVATGF
ncbi:MAG: A24 family peptidase [Nocardioides sp.]|nr:A24 family peptidase [Nocardioides sp.]